MHHQPQHQPKHQPPQPDQPPQKNLALASSTSWFSFCSTSLSTCFSSLRLGASNMSYTAESHEFQARLTALCSPSADEVQKSPPRFMVQQVNSPLARPQKPWCSQKAAAAMANGSEICPKLKGHYTIPHDAPLLPDFCIWKLLPKLRSHCGIPSLVAHLYGNHSTYQHMPTPLHTVAYLRLGGIQEFLDLFGRHGLSAPGLFNGRLVFGCVWMFLDN